MSEISPIYIPCAAGGQSQRECLLQITGSLIELLGHAGMQFTPADARSAAKALWAMADSIEGKKAPRIDSQAVEALVNAAWVVVLETYREKQTIPNATLELEKALNTLTGDC